jgi:hypothetical protein
MNKKQIYVTVTDFPGIEYVGKKITRADLVANLCSDARPRTGFASRREADAYAQSCADWAAQFESPQGFLVVRKQGSHKGYRVVAQY